MDSDSDDEMIVTFHADMEDDIVTVHATSTSQQQSSHIFSSHAHSHDSFQPTLTTCTSFPLLSHHSSHDDIHISSHDMELKYSYPSHTTSQQSSTMSISSSHSHSHSQPSSFLSFQPPLSTSTSTPLLSPLTSSTLSPDPISSPSTDNEYKYSHHHLSQQTFITHEPNITLSPQEFHTILHPILRAGMHQLRTEVEYQHASLQRQVEQVHALMSSYDDMVIQKIVKSGPGPPHRSTPAGTTRTIGSTKSISKIQHSSNQSISHIPSSNQSISYINSSNPPIQHSFHKSLSHLPPPSHPHLCYPDIQHTSNTSLHIRYPTTMTSITMGTAASMRIDGTVNPPMVIHGHGHGRTLSSVASISSTPSSFESQRTITGPASASSTPSPYGCRRSIADDKQKHPSLPPISSSHEPSHERKLTTSRCICM